VRNLSYKHKLLNDNKEIDISDKIHKILQLFSRGIKEKKEFKNLRDEIKDLPHFKLLFDLLENQDKKKVNKILNKIIPKIEKGEGNYSRFDLVIKKIPDINQAYEIFHAINTINTKLSEADKFRNFAYKNFSDSNLFDLFIKNFNNRMSMEGSNDKLFMRFFSETISSNSITATKTYDAFVREDGQPKYKLNIMIKSFDDSDKFFNKKNKINFVDQ
jgi:hypothetical protein